ncbi:hypothetical protein EON83_26060 [bacterium]|nr:MAG: hypothetical protein EON83_26060 [bacterium]
MQNTIVQDTIQREIAIKAPKERVYAAIADPTQIIKWFPDAVEGSLEIGERPVFDFGEYGKNRIYVEAAQPHEYFAFRWIPGSNHFMGDVLSTANTLVEFHIKESDGLTQVTMIESGFASLPTEVAEESLRQNTDGWGYMLSRLEKEFATQ